MTLPNPIGRQKEVLALPAQGHFAVLGTAGSGKTTLAILRSAYLANSITEHCGKTLLVTFNRALVAYLKHLQDRSMTNVVIENYHTFARGYLASRKKMSGNCILNNSQQRDQLIKNAVEQVARKYVDETSHLFLSNPVEYFSEMIRWISQHRSNDNYVEKCSEHYGCEATLLREIYHQYCTLRSEQGKDYDWDNMAFAVCQELAQDTSPRLYRHIVIDEGQDFSPTMIKSLALATSPNGSLTFFGDVAQQIYGHRMSWRNAGLDIHKVWEFKENYRNTKQIARLALAISQMPYFKGVADIIEPISPPADGALPTLVKCRNQTEELNLVKEQAVSTGKTQTVAILFRDRQDEQLIEPHIPQNSIRLHRKISTWQARPGIYYGTYHSAKGLEFDVVILPFCEQQKLPKSKTIEAFGIDNAKARDGRLLYVGVTRAKTRLIITYSDQLTSLLPSNNNLYKQLYSY